MGASAVFLGACLLIFELSVIKSGGGVESDDPSLIQAAAQECG